MYLFVSWDVIAYNVTLTVVKYKSELQLRIYTPCLAFMVDLWGICCECFGENLLHFIEMEPRCIALCIGVFPRHLHDTFTLVMSFTWVSIMWMAGWPQ